MRRFAIALALAAGLTASAALAQPVLMAPSYDGGTRPGPFGQPSSGDNRGGIYWDAVNGHLYVSDGGTWVQVTLAGDPANLASGLCTTDIFGNLTCQDAGFQNVTAKTILATGIAASQSGNTAVSIQSGSYLEGAGAAIGASPVHFFGYSSGGAEWIISDTLVPNGGASFNLGSSALPWLSVWSNNLDYAGTLNLCASSATACVLGTSTTTHPVKVAGGNGAFVGSCAMSAGTTCTATVPTGSKCSCFPQTAVAVSTNNPFGVVSGTTMTCNSGGTSNSATWTILCL